jgi:hypothetical protein
MPEQLLSDRRHPRSRAAASLLAGICVTLLGFEAVLRVFVTPIDAVTPAIADDSVGGAPVVVRQFDEGIATAHFSAAGARLTGNDWIEPAKRVVIMGDSYVAAREVADGETMGAWLERMARHESIPLDVRQYGWRGASPARYVVAAPEVLERWQPSVVVIPLSSDDLDERAVSGMRPVLSVDADGTWGVICDPADTAVSGPHSAGPRSVLALVVRRRWEQLWARAPRPLHRFARSWNANASNASIAAAPANAPALEMLPAAVVQSLKQAFGARLVVAYVADVRVTGGERADPAEARLLDACRAQAVTCVSLRRDMLAARAAGTVVRGFATTTLGVGHLNPQGHRLVATALWPLVRERLTTAPARD